MKILGFISGIAILISCYLIFGMVLLFVVSSLLENDDEALALVIFWPLVIIMIVIKGFLSTFTHGVDGLVDLFERIFLKGANK